MPNVTRGVRMKGLLEYLAGPGKANEHTNPRLVAGDPSLLPWLGNDHRLDVASARLVAARIDQPRRLMGVEVARGSVWHCSLSVRADDKAVSDKMWLAISRDFVAEMGFTGGNKAGCRWVAVHHGKSKEGNDHVHIAVSLVREDGTIASTWNDFARAQKIAGQLEKKHGLAVLASRGAGRGDRGVMPAEVAKAARAGAAEPQRLTLERTVRACAAAAVGEGDFLARIGDEGLVVRARFAQGSRAVVGYSVAARPQAGQAPIWFGGGRLAKDLTLPRLRASWTPGAEEAGVAASEWSAVGWGVTPGPVAPVDTSPAAWAVAQREVGALAQRWRAGERDGASWIALARESAGVFAACSRAVEESPGEMAQRAREMANLVGVRAHRARPARSGSARTAVALLSAGGRGRGVSQAVLAREVADLVDAIVKLAMIIGDVRAAQLEADRDRQHRAYMHQLSFPSPPSSSRPGADAPSQYDLGPTLPPHLRPSPEAGNDFGR